MIKILKGLPASGKSTYAKSLVQQGWLRVNRDSLRLMLSDGAFSDENEKVVRAMRNSAIAWAIAVGKDIVVDDTNLNPREEQEIRQLADRHAEVVVRVFPVSVIECCRRDSERTGIARVGYDVITGMAERYDWPPDTFPEGVEIHEEVGSAISSEGSPGDSG